MLSSNEIKDLLKEHNLKITKNRIDIMNQFLDDHQFHTISEITKNLKHTNTKSIYNNIQKLIQVGILESFSVAGEVCYEIVDIHKMDKHQAHVIHGDDIEHLDIPQKTFKDIENFANKNDIKPKRIKIIIER